MNFNLSYVIRLIGSIFDTRRFKAIRKNLNSNNYIYYCDFLFFATVCFFFTSVASFIIPNQLTMALEFLGAFIFSLILFLIAIFLLKNKKEHILIIFYLTDAIYLTFGLLLGTFLDTTSLAITFIVMINIIPIFLLDYHWRCWAFQIFFSLTFITCDYFAKPSSLFFYDLIDAVFFTLTALGISLFTHEIRITSIENYLKLEKTAEEDLLTGLYNRGTGVKKLTEIVNNKTPGLFVMADLDDFKKVNDTYGHMAGDEALRLFSSKLKTLFSKDGTIIMRFGGDEFAFWIQSSLTYEQTKELLSMAISEIDKLKLKDHPEYEMHISIGCTISDGKNIEDFNQLYAVTDKALYRAKREGKHQYVIEGYGK